MRRLGTLALLTLLTACNSGPGSPTGATHIGGGSGSKSTLAIWTATGQSWSARLDSGAANLTGTAFQLIFSFTDGSAVTCTATLSGNEIGGNLNVYACAASASGLASSTGAAAFQTNGVGTYANTGSTLTLCPSVGGCQAYN